MGREIKRVALDFNWKLSKTWQGYLNPHHKPCPENLKTCFGGYTAAAKWLDALVRFISTMGEEANVSPERVEQFKTRGRTYPHPYLTGFAQAPTLDTPPEIYEKANATEHAWERRQVFEEYHRTHPTEVLPLNTRDLAEFVNGLMEEKPRGVFSHYEGAYKLQEKLLKLAGVYREDWGVCPVCKGDSIHPDAVKAYEEWTATEPPEGEGWQMWETVSEGSPITPVFATKEGLVEHLCSTTGYAATDWGRGKTYQRKDAEAFVNSGWAPTALMANGKMYDAVESAGLHAKEAEGGAAEAEED